MKLYAAILLLIVALTADAFPARTVLLQCAWAPVLGANAYRVIYDTNGNRVTNDCGKRLTALYTFVRTNPVTVYCHVQAWLPELWEWLDYPVCQYPPAPPVLDYVLLTGPTNAPVEMSGDLAHWQAIGIVPATGLNFCASDGGWMFRVQPAMAANAVQGPTQPLVVTPIYKRE